MEEQIQLLDDHEDLILGKTMNSNLYVISKIKRKKIPVKAKHFLKPSFSYYPNLESIEAVGKNDDKVVNFPKKGFQFEDEVTGEKFDAEVIIMEAGSKKEQAQLIFNALKEETKDNSMYEVVSELEHIFGLVWSMDKKSQIGLIGELLIIKKFPDYSNVLLSAFHLDEWDGGDKTRTDFSFMNLQGEHSGLEIKTTSSDKLFTLKNDQIDKALNKHYAAVKYNSLPTGGTTLIELIEWFLSKAKNENIIMREYLELINKRPPHKLVRFDEESVKIRFISINSIPKIENKNDNIKNISFEIDLFLMDEVSPSEVFGQEN